MTFDDPAYDESGPQQDDGARPSARGTVRSRCGAAEIAPLFPTVVRHAEQPILRTAPAPLYRLAGLVREDGIKVVLSGEGADEVFAGYDLLQGSGHPALCGAPADFAAAPAALPPALSLPGRAQPADARSAGCLLRHPARPGERSTLLAPAADAQHRRGQAVLLGGAARTAGRIAMPARAGGPVAGGVRPLAPPAPGAISSKRRPCCRATSFPARATAWRWRMASRRGFRSSTTG